MSAPSGAGGGELGTVFINVAPTLAGMADKWKQVGKELQTGITQGMKDAPVPSDTGVLGEVIAGKPVGTATRTAAQKAGKEIGTGLSTGLGGALKDLGKEAFAPLKDAAKDWASGVADQLKSGDVKGAFGEVGTVVENTTSLISNLGQTIGVNLDEVAGFGHTVAATMGGVGGDVQGLVDQIKTGVTDVRSFADNIKAIGTGDTATRLGAVSDLMKKIDDHAKDAGVDLGGIPGELGQIADAAGGIAGTVTEIKELGAALGVAAGPAAILAADIVAIYEAWKFAKEHVLADLGSPGQNVQLPNLPVNPPGAPHAGEPRPGTVEPSNLPPGWVIGPGGIPMKQHAAGGSTDTVPAMLTPGEYIINRDRATKYRPLLDMMNFGSYQEGGVVGPDVTAAEGMVGTPYSQGNRTDCSGMTARIINAALHTGGSGGLMSTKNAQEWLAARGFTPGVGGPGEMTVYWYDRGPNPDDGHMVMVLSNGQIAESGGGSGSYTVGAHPNLGQFDHMMHRRVGLFGEGQPGAPGGGALAGGGGGTTGTVGGGGGGGMGAEQFGGSLVKGALQELGFPDVFGKDPSQWGLWKMGMVGLNYGLGLAKMFGGHGTGGAGIPGMPSLGGMPGAAVSGAAAAAGVGPAAFGGINITHNDNRGAIGVGVPGGQSQAEGLVQGLAFGNSSAPFPTTGAAPLGAQ